jgi:hypothetical protein
MPALCLGVGAESGTVQFLRGNCGAVPDWDNDEDGQSERSALSQARLPVKAFNLAGQRTSRVCPVRRLFGTLKMAKSQLVMNPQAKIC